jgi:uncharacterized protein (DUF736 family)
MASIGTLTRRPDGAYTGSITIKSYGGKAFLQPIRRTSDSAPDFRLFGVGDGGHKFEAGAAWTKTRKDGDGEYVSLKIDFPELPAPIYATLGVMAGQDDPDVMAIIWNRPSESKGGGDPFAGLAAVGDPADPDGVLDEEHHSHPDNGPDQGPADSAFGGLDSEDAVAGEMQPKRRRSAKTEQPDGSGERSAAEPQDPTAFPDV